jgi:hypothetical protein
MVPEITGTEGKGLTVTETSGVAEEQPFTSVTVTDLPEVVATETERVVSPVFHNHELPALAVRSTEDPSQNAVAPSALMVAIGKGLTVTACTVDVFLQPLPSVMVTDLFAVLFTVMVLDVSPLSQSQELPALAVSVTDPPAQKVVALPAVIVAAGKGLTVTACTAEEF